jgi:hypothetical protein
VLNNYPIFKHNYEPLNNHWIAGFVNADGAFYLGHLSKKEDYKINPSFTISQHDRDLFILNQIMSIFNCGRIYSVDNNCSNFQITGIKNLTLNLNSISNFFFNILYMERRQKIGFFRFLYSFGFN